MLNKATIPAILTSCLLAVGGCSFPNLTAATKPTALSAQPGVGITVRPGNSDWLEEQFTTEIINIGLEALGYTVEPIKQADYELLNLSLANGDLDFSTGYYKLGHEAFYENAGGDEKLEQMGILVPGSGQQSIMIDQAVATQYQISSIEQLQDPDLAQLFDTDGDGKANLFGCQVGWGCNATIEHFIEVYGLTDTVEQDQGDYTALLASVLTLKSQNQPFMLYIYSPHWILLELKPGEDILPLTVPFTSLPEGTAGLTAADTTVDGKNLGFPVAEQMLLASQSFVDENSVARRWFELVEIPVEAMIAESLRIQDGENTPEDIRRHAEEWVTENRSVFEGWLDQARAVAD